MGKERVCVFFHSFFLFTGFFACEDIQLGQSHYRHEVICIRKNTNMEKVAG